MRGNTLSICYILLYYIVVALTIRVYVKINLKVSEGNARFPIGKLYEDPGANVRLYFCRVRAIIENATHCTIL